MSLKKQIFEDLKAAMKAGEAEKRDVLRMLDSMIKNVEIEKMKRESWLSDEQTLEVIARAVKQRKDAVAQYESGGLGFWSLYEYSGTRMKMLASPFYHALHIVQLQMHRLTGEPVFRRYAERWDAYRQDLIKRSAALVYKAIFKIFYY